MLIKDIPNAPWRKKWYPAWFRDATFFMETGTRGGGRRVALHEYPKRSIDYAEDMGKKANRFLVNGYLIGPNYLVDKDILINALEMDGPGTLRLPLQYMAVDLEVMVQNYSVSESRERGGFCTIEMEFVEYGTPFYRPTVSTTAVVAQAATNVENAVVGPNEPTTTTAQQAAPYGKVLQNADTSPAPPSPPSIFTGAP
jgi:prophage DNA circulation protein